MSGRCSPTEALDLLRPAFKPMAAAKRLTDAIHDNEAFRLWCDDAVVPVHFRVRLKVEPKLDPDGRWTARIVSVVREAWEKPDKPVYKWGSKDELEAAPYRWEFEIDEVMALLPQRKARLKPGPKGHGDWKKLIRGRMKSMGPKRVQELHNSGKMRERLEALLRQKKKWVPADEDAVNAEIRAFLKGEFR